MEVAALVSLAAGGHDDALSELYRRYSGLLLRVAFGMLGNRRSRIGQIRIDSDQLHSLVGIALLKFQKIGHIRICARCAVALDP